MSTPAVAPAMTNPANRIAAGPSTPAKQNTPPTTSTPKSHHTPGVGHGSFTSPAVKGTPRPFGTPVKSGTGAAGGKTIAGASNVGGKSVEVGSGTPSLGFGSSALSIPSPAFNFRSPNTSGAGIVNIEASSGFSNITSGFGASDGGVGMGISLSSLGINMMSTGMSMSGSAAGKADDAERRRRLEAILNTVGQRPGRISREGLERLGRRCGMDIQPGEVNELAMAGKNVLVDIEFGLNQSQVVERVALALATASDALAEHSEKAALILKKDLTPPPGVSTINATLDSFADNLERLARLDKLSMPGASCFDAVFGVYTSLKRLYDHEKEIAKELYSNEAGDQVEKEVLCKRSGRPRMHAGRRVGLSLEYWMDQHLVGTSTKRDLLDSDMTDFDNPEQSSESEDNNQTFSITIECEYSSPALYPPIRITSDWLSSRVMKPADDLERTANDVATPAAPVMYANKPTIDWLDPPPPILPPSTSPEAPSSSSPTANSSLPNQPQVRFIARLEPPIALPLHIATQVYASTGVDISADIVSQTTIPGLALPHHTQNIRSRRTIDDGASSTTDWEIGLYPTRAEPARVVDKLPFEHPRQLVALLPVLRQYAFITRLLQNSLPKASLTGDGVGDPLHEGKQQGKQELEAELAALLAPEPVRGSLGRRLDSGSGTLDVAFATTPSPQVTCVFAVPGGATRRVTMNVLPDAEVLVVEQDVAGGLDEKEKPGGGETERAQNEVEPGGEGEVRATVTGKVEKALARALVVSEDLGIWAEWVVRRFVG